MTDNSSLLSQLFIELTRNGEPEISLILNIMSKLGGGGKLDLFVYDADGVFTNTASSATRDLNEDSPFSPLEALLLRNILRQAVPLPIEAWPADSALASHSVLGGAIAFPLSGMIDILGFVLYRGPALNENMSGLLTLLSMLLGSFISSQQTKSVLEQDFLIAQHVQRYLLPRAKPVVGGLGYHVVFSAARVVTGDFYDYVSPRPSELNFIVGDVSGKGVGAALLMANIVPGLRSVISEYQSIEETMLRLHECVYEAAPLGSYATLFYGCINLDQFLFRYVNAGHQPAPFLIREGKEIAIQELTSGGSVLGLFKRPRKPYRVGKVGVRSRDVIICATDGVTDAEGPDGEMLGEERLHRAAIDTVKGGLKAEVIASALYEYVKDYRHDLAQTDDITIAVFVVD